MFIHLLPFSSSPRKRLGPSAALHEGTNVKTLGMPDWACRCRVWRMVVCSTWIASLLWLVVVGPAPSWGLCRVEEGVDPRMMVRLLEGPCSDEDRRMLAVSADEVLKALHQDKGVVLKGVVLVGDLPLDRLRLRPLESEPVRHSTIIERIETERVSEVRVIHGPFILEDVEVRDVLATNLLEAGYVVARGPVSLRGSTIRRSMDFSRMIFLDRADFSEMHVGHEGFFIRAMFARDVDFSGTAFGTHTRFHQARFLGKATFTGAQFHGLAEFLEVSFTEADFSRARFFQGMGFSGSRFHEALDLSEARFEREAYFRFVESQGETNVHRTQFQDTADFTEARFRGDVDFRAAVFENPSLLSGIEFHDRSRGELGVRNRDFFLLLFLLALLGLILLAMWKRKAW